MPVFDRRSESPHHPPPTSVSIRNGHEICLANGSTNRCEGSLQCEKDRPRCGFNRIRRLVLVTFISDTMLMLITTQIKAISPRFHPALSSRDVSMGMFSGYKADGHECTFPTSSSRFMSTPPVSIETTRIQSPPPTRDRGISFARSAIARTSR